MYHPRFKFSTQNFSNSLVILLLLYILLSNLESVGSAVGAAMGQTAAPSTTVPPYLNYQGQLRDPEGNPLSGSYKMTFRIYHDVTAPMTAAVWNETHEAVTVRNGQFNVLLGNNTPIPAAIFGSSDVFIGVQVAAFDELVPRQRFASVPYAAHADFANGLQRPGGQGVDALFVDPNGKLVATQSLSLTQSSGITGPNTIDSSNALAINANSGQNVGVGTNDPKTKLHVNGGNARVQNGSRTLDMNADPNSDWAGIESNGSVYLHSQNYLQLASGFSGSVGDVLINPHNAAKRVGIGLYGPQYTLDVNGTTNVRGELRVNNAKPVLIRRYENVGDNADFDTGISEFEYNCVVTSWSTHYDFWENGTGINAVWPYARDGTWKVLARFHSHNDNENPDVDLLCFRLEISDYQGDKSIATAD